MAVSFPSNADSAQLATDGYSEVILLAPESSTSGITVDYLVLAGGGGGGGVIDGGGGAGGYRASWGTGTDGTGGNSGGLSSLETALTMTSGIAYSITVGQGGEGGVGWSNGTNHRGHKGRTSSISGSDITTVTTTGGGGGHGYGTVTHSDRNGGSGGGGSLGVTTGGTGTTGEGFAGGNGLSDDEAGGGGGAGAVGGNASASVGGDGGVGLASTITGVSITRAGGGGGGSRNPRTPGDGGAGGGGGGGDDTLSPSNYVDGNAGNEAEHGRSQYGGGGGGAGYSAGSDSQLGGSGGSGIAIFRIPSTVTYSSSQLASDVSSASNCTATYSAATDGSGDHVITFTVTTEDPFDGGGTTNDGTITWTPTLVVATSTTFTIPEGVDSVSIVAIGPGGGSGGSNGSNAGGGGGGGGLSWINSVAVSEGSTITLTGGTRGIGGDSGGADGDSGTASTVSLSYLGEISYSGVNINPFNDVLLTGDSATGILTARSNRGTDSDVISALGQLDSISIGSGRLTVFGVFTNSIGTALQSTITNSPYIDSNGNSTVGPTDPNDVRGYGPGGDELKQVIIRSRAGDTITPV